MGALSTVDFLEAKGDNRGLINPFTGETAKNVQHQHLTNFREIGYLLRIFILCPTVAQHRGPNQKKGTAHFLNKESRPKESEYLCSGKTAHVAL